MNTGSHGAININSGRCGEPTSFPIVRLKPRWTVPPGPPAPRARPPWPWDVKLTVHDPAGAAGVTIDLVRMAALALRQRRGGYLAEAAPLLKSPPGTSI